MRTPTVDEVLSLRANPEAAVFYTNTSTPQQANILQVLLDAGGEFVGPSEIMAQTGVGDTHLGRLRDDYSLGKLLTAERGRGLALNVSAYQEAVQTATDIELAAAETLRTLGDKVIGRLIIGTGQLGLESKTRLLNEQTMTLLLAYTGLCLQFRHFGERFRQVGLLTEGERDRHFARRMKTITSVNILRQIIGFDTSKRTTATYGVKTEALAAIDPAAVQKTLYIPLRTPRPPKKKEPEEPLPSPEVQAEPEPDPETLVSSEAEAQDNNPVLAKAEPVFVFLRVPESELDLTAEVLELLTSSRAPVRLGANQQRILGELTKQYSKATARPLVVSLEDDKVRLTLLSRNGPTIFCQSA